MLIRRIPTTLLQIFCKIIFNSKVIVESDLDLDSDHLQELMSIIGLIVGIIDIPPLKKQCFKMRF